MYKKLKDFKIAPTKRDPDGCKELHNKLRLSTLKIANNKIKKQELNSKLEDLKKVLLSTREKIRITNKSDDKYDFYIALMVEIEKRIYDIKAKIYKL